MLIDVVQGMGREQNGFETLEASLNDISREELSGLLMSCGVIPERFDHDSSEEKLWAKACDILLKIAFQRLGIEAQVIRVRGNSADVLITAPDYTVVADAKAFRLSRTAKNQKDFKVGALNDWRRENTFACLVAPYFQFPKSKSQIYQQAITHGIALLSYTHLRLLLAFAGNRSLIPIWNAPKSIAPSMNAQIYHSTVLQAVLEVCEQPAEEWERFLHDETLAIQNVASEGVSFWQSQIANYQNLSREEAIQRLIKAQRIEQKIRTLQAFLRSVP